MGLKQETRDDSIVQEKYERKVILDKDLMRFHKRSNEITNCMGSGNMTINNKIISNQYHKILLATDGVTDCLSQSQLLNILERASKYKVSEDIVQNALNNISYLPTWMPQTANYYNKIEGGKDNTTAVVYARK